MMISADVMETSVTTTDYLQSHRYRSTLTWKIKPRCPMVLLCINYSLFNTNHKKWICEILKVSVVHYIYISINRFVNPFTVQNDLLVAFSLCCSSADHKQVPFVVGI